MKKQGKSKTKMVKELSKLSRNQLVEILGHGGNRIAFLKNGLRKLSQENFDSILVQIGTSMMNGKRKTYFEIDAIDGATRQKLIDIGYFCDKKKIQDPASCWPCKKTMWKIKFKLSNEERVSLARPEDEIVDSEV